MKILIYVVYHIIFSSISIFIVLHLYTVIKFSIFLVQAYIFQILNL